MPFSCWRVSAIVRPLHYIPSRPLDRGDTCICTSHVCPKGTLSHSPPSARTFLLCRPSSSSLIQLVRIPLKSRRSRTEIPYQLDRPPSTAEVECHSRCSTCLLIAASASIVFSSRSFGALDCPAPVASAAGRLDAAEKLVWRERRRDIWIVRAVFENEVPPVPFDEASSFACTGFWLSRRTRKKSHSCSLND